MHHDLIMTKHAITRSRQRQISKELIMLALCYGRCRHERGADHYIVGWREIEYWKPRGVNLSMAKNIRVVCDMDGTILTVYRQQKRARLSRVTTD